MADLKNGYRRGVAAILMNSEGLVWVGERSDIAGAWQFPQGGVDEGESLPHALQRELEEETGLEEADYKVLDTHPEWLCYDFPDRATLYGERVGQKGQCIKFYLVQFLGQEIDLSKAKDEEFQAGKWVSPDWIVQNVVAFRQPLYAEALRYFEPMMAPFEGAPVAEVSSA